MRRMLGFTRPGFMVFLIAAYIVFIGFARPALGAECAPFYDSLNDASSVAANGGSVSGTLSFASGVSGDGASFNGGTSVRYSSSLFNSESGSVTFWFRKNSADVKGGMMQIGQLSQPNSIGIFYNNQNDLYFEIRNNGNSYSTTYSLGALSGSEFKHIAAVWSWRGGTYYTKLFINGGYVSGQSLAGSFVHNQGAMDIGVSGSGEWYGNGEGVMDELRFFNWPISDSEAYMDYVYSSNRFRNRGNGKPVSTGSVKIVNMSLVVNGNPFKVKGVAYQPIPIGSSNDRSTLNSIFTNPAIISRDVALLRDMGANTVRLWAELPDATLLDALYNNGNRPIYAILAIEVPATTDDPNIDYSNPATIANLVSHAATYVNRFKSHPAVLAWAIGNENNLHYTKTGMADWYSLANKMAKAAYEAEGASYHPTMAVNGYTIYFGISDLGSDDVSMNYTDLWGHNTYNGYDYHCYFDYYSKITAKPLVMTEYGVDAYNTTSSSEYEGVQSSWDMHQWAQVRDNSLGGTIMAYSDEWWKAGSPSTHNTGGYSTDVQPDIFSNEEWWGVMRPVDNGANPDIMQPRQIYNALKSEWYQAGLTGDTNNDCRVDIFDLAKVGLCFGCASGQPCWPGCAAADVKSDGRIDIFDLATVGLNYRRVC